MINLIKNTKPTNSVSNKLNNNTISRFNTTINQTANINCFEIELSTNILLTKGYYNFAFDIESDDAISMYLGYKDSQNKDKMIFRKVLSHSISFIFLFVNSMLNHQFHFFQFG